MRKIIYADSVYTYLVEEGQNNASKYGFRLGDTIKFSPSQVHEIIEKIPSTEIKEGYTEADYIFNLHKRYGCSLTVAKEAHDKALEFLRNRSMVSG